MYVHNEHVSFLCLTIQTYFLAGEKHEELTLGKETSEFTTQCDGYKYFKITNNNACKDLKITVSTILWVIGF